ncbi:MAG: hypothetical protein LBC67_03325 [Spirochaetales bacterium]|jgi:tetratricopeptide (TPR) repeat protein|nr:hypothetical protein [Spirochaetales bacterium]
MGKKLCLCVFLSGFLAGLAPLSGDEGLARLYFESAKNFAEAASRAEALEFLKSALIFRPEYSDALLLQSRLFAEEASGLPRALEAARSAVKHGTWEASSRSEGALFLAGLLVDTKNWKEALTLIESLPPGTPSADELVLKLRCYRGLRDRLKLDAVLKTALEGFPQDSRFLEIFFKTADPLKPDTVKRFELMDKTLAQNLPAFAAYILSAKSADNILTLAWDYFRAGGNDPAVSCLLMEQGLVEPVREMERFVSLGGMKRLDLLRKAFLSTRQKHPSLVAELLAAFTGVSVLDKDGDAIPEERFHVKSGEPFLWEIDRDQDGVAEISVEFGSRRFSPASRFSPEPERITYRQGGTVMVCIYAGYPYLEKVLYEDEVVLPQSWLSSAEDAAALAFRRSGAAFLGNSSPVQRRVLNHISPASLGVEILSGSSFAEEPFGKIPWIGYALNARAEFLPLEKVHSFTSMYEERNSASADYAKRVFLRGGEAVQIDIVFSGGEKEIILHRIVLDGGRISYGLRDIDRDGVFDVREFFEDGKLRSLSLGKEGGKEEYRETFFPDILKEWDFNRDGIIDARELWTSAGPLRHYFEGDKK